MPKFKHKHGNFDVIASQSDGSLGSLHDIAAAGVVVMSENQPNVTTIDGVVHPSEATPRLVRLKATLGGYTVTVNPGDWVVLLNGDMLSCFSDDLFRSEYPEQLEAGA